MNFNPEKADWIFKPEDFSLDKEKVEITTAAGTDFWQRTYYGFRNDNAPGLLMESRDNFTFSLSCSFEYRTEYDQCGVLVYLDSDNWMKAGLEYENSDFSRLGSVVTNSGYSDWATTDIENLTKLYMRLHRRGPDFLIEYSYDGNSYRQMRIFHIHALGDTTEAMGRAEPAEPPGQAVRFGLFACSPGDSSFTALFSDFELDACRWSAH